MSTFLGCWRLCLSLPALRTGEPMVSPDSCAVRAAKPSENAAAAYFAKVLGRILHGTASSCDFVTQTDTSGPSCLLSASTVLVHRQESVVERSILLRRRLCRAERIFLGHLREAGGDGSHRLPQGILDRAPGVATFFRRGGKSVRSDRADKRGGGRPVLRFRFSRRGSPLLSASGHRPALRGRRLLSCRTGRSRRTR